MYPRFWKQPRLEIPIHPTLEGDVLFLCLPMTDPKRVFMICEVAGRGLDYPLL